MAVSEELLVSVKIDTKDGTVAVKDLTVSFKDLEKAAKGGGDSVDKAGEKSQGASLKFTELNSALELAKKAYTALIGPINKVVGAFFEQEKAEFALTSTLQALGFETKGALADLKKFASELQNTTTIGDETTLGMAQIAKSMGLTNAETKKIIKTAAGMSAVLGTDVNTAFNELIGQLNGATGRSAKFVKGLKDLNEAQLKSGQGIELAARQYEKFAELQGGSLAGTATIAAHAFEDILEEIGKIISEFVNLPDIMRGSIKSFQEIAEQVKEFGARLQVLKAGLAEISFEQLAKSAASLAAAFGLVAVAFNSQAIVTGILSVGKALAATAVPAALAAAKFALIAGAVVSVVIAIETVVVNMERLPQLVETIKVAFLNFFQRLIRGFASIAAAGLGAIETILEPLAKFSSVADAALGKVRQGMLSLADTAEEADKNVEELDKRVKETAKGLEMGPTLDLIVKGAKAVMNSFGDVKVAAEEAGDSFDDIDLKGPIAATREQLQLIEQLKIENKALEKDVMNFGAEQMDVIQNQLDLILGQVDARKKQLDLEGKLAGPAGAEIIGQLEKQKQLQQDIADLKQIQNAEQEIAKTNPIAQAAGAAGAALGKGINQAVPLLNKALGTNIDKLSGKTIAAFAIGAAKFFDSFEGFMAGSAQIVGSTIQGAAAGVDKIFGTSFAKGAESFGKAFAGFAGATGMVFDKIFSVVMKMFDPKFIQGIADMLVNFVETLPQNLMKAFEALSDAVGKVIEKLPEIVNRLIDSMGKIFDKLLAQAPKLIDALADALVVFLDRLPELTGKLFAALPGLIDKLLSRLPDIIDALFKAIPAIITQLIKAIPGIIVAILENLPDILQSLISGIIGAMGEIVAAFVDFLIGGGLEKIVVALIKAIPKIAAALVKGIVQGLQRALGAIFGGFKTPEFIEQLGDLPKNLGKGMKELGKTAAKESSKLFKVLDLENAANAVDRLKQAEKVTDIIDDAADAVSIRIKGLWQTFLDALKRLWEWIVDHIWKPFFEALKAIWTWVYDNVLEPVIKGLKEAWMAIYNNFILPMLNGIKAVWQYVYQYVIQPIVNIVRTAWDGIMNFFNNLFKGKIDEAFSSVISTMQGIGSQIWNGLKSGIEGGMSLFKNLGSNIWEGLWNGLSQLGDIFRNTLNSINPGNLLAKMFSFDGGGRGKVENALGIDVPFVSFAEGGIVPGSPVVRGDSPLNDRILALLSPGEYVVPRSVMQKQGASELISAVAQGLIDPLKLWGVSVGPVSVGSDGVKVDGRSPGQIATDTINSISDAGRSLGDRAGDLGSAIEKGGKDFWDKAQEIGQDVWDELAKLDPTKLWDRVKDVIWDSVWKMVTHSAGRFHDGGLVPGYAGGGDVMARLQPGEYVMSRSAVNALGTGFMNQINGGAATSGGQPIYNVDMKVMIEASSQSLDESFVRGRLIPAIKDEFKKSSLRGEFLISDKGIRNT